MPAERMAQLIVIADRMGITEKTVKTHLTHVYQRLGVTTRREMIDAFRSALARDKTRTQVFDISELGLVEMTRKRIGEGLLTAFAGQCPECSGRGVQVDFSLLD